MYRIKPCLQCQTETRNQKFCSSSCAATYNNLHGRTGRDRISRNCKNCGAVLTQRRKLCLSCRALIKTNTGELVPANKITKGQISTNDTQKYRRIRKHARAVARELGLLKKCRCCEYSIHVECGHLHPISGYPDSTLVSVINDPKNLCGLCRNHHWEVDHKILDLATLSGVEPETEV